MMFIVYIMVEYSPSAVTSLSPHDTYMTVNYAIIDSDNGLLPVCGWGHGHH